VPVSGNPPPRYPAAARRRGVEGTVLVRLKVDGRGRVLDAEVLRSSGSKLLDEAAASALRRWRFTPGWDQKGVVESTVTVPVKFALRDEE
jgi:protein TonB